MDRWRLGLSGFVGRNLPIGIALPHILFILKTRSAAIENHPILRFLMSNCLSTLMRVQKRT
jgi:hypothetical protein